MKKNSKRTAVVLIPVIAALLVALTLWIWWGNTTVGLSEYTVCGAPKGFSGFRIAHVSDLHNAEMGDGNERLLNVLREAEPDLIAITGDLIDSRHTDIGIALRFAAEAVGIAPCCYVPGNHEARTSEYAELAEGLTDLGVTVLTNTSISIELSGCSITVMGIDDPSFQTNYMFDNDAAVTEEKLRSIRPNGYTVLLTHRPELFDVYESFGIDLVLAGHAHGGQIRLPFVGGLIAPDQGIFPKYDSGLYIRNGTHMLVSRGIGNSLFPFRINNRPEVILTELRYG